ncbi:MAG: peptidoglycan DD-metalloendopeptidase family protein [Phenylobacterium sp.]|uniref:peptidoglycan DD-metalloendopeptidase family protein n=1 Tax=Phenylobacterium sp. TaxID=1871053 RepID=UPI0025D13C5F|nr:peptidoglycan DD-metalloendopeptidase family protein [Phenylobacterium sp.]MBI1199056.1 peptidoglycan DD-metalloendopeptidase family protein [Phenylobacterium sp.]
MKSGVRARLHELVVERPLQVLVVAAVIGATAAAAAPLAGAPILKASLARGAAGPAASEPTITKLVWEGADLDGDGVADFANPTGHAPRGHDAYGDGEFGASRDGGARRHEGVDYAARAGQLVRAPISGFVTKIGFAYPGDTTLKFVEITNPALKVAARVFYVDPKVEEGAAVLMGRPIGVAHSLQRKYPAGMTDHVHLELIDRRGAHFDAERVLVAKVETVEMGD